MKYGDVSLEQVEAAINKLGGIEGFHKLLRGELIISENKWHEKNGVIYFKVTSKGVTGQQWIERLEKQGSNLSRSVKDMLLSKNFKATLDVVYTIAALRVNLFKAYNHGAEKICKEATRRKLLKPSLEVACLIRERFSDKEIKDMNLYWIVTFHEPIKDYEGDLTLLRIDSYADRNSLDDIGYNSMENCNNEGAFVFEVSQTTI